jgi:hypothetical protein
VLSCRTGGLECSALVPLLRVEVLSFSRVEVLSFSGINDDAAFLAALQKKIASALFQKSKGMGHLPLLPWKVESGSNCWLN